MNTLWIRFQFISLKFLEGRLLWFFVALLILMKLILLSGSPIQMVFGPHDDGLYVSRAFHLLTDGGLGPYDARLLCKLPGISLWLAGARLLGIPYLISINLLYALAGVYFFKALDRCKVNRFVILIAFGLYLFNPVSFDHQWFRLLREPLSIGLLVIMLGSMIFILSHLQEKRLSLAHFLVLAITFAFALLVREEDRVLYALLAMFLSLVLFSHWSELKSGSWPLRTFAISLVCLPFFLALVSNLTMRSYVERHYGAPLLHDFGEGEFPRLIGAIRSIESKKDNRLVMITQETLEKLRKVAPSFVPVIDRLPPPSETSYSCIRFRVCNEWTSGWELFWVKDSAFAAGLTPTLPAGQAYFRSVRLEIERACRDGRLSCKDKGEGLIPPFELKWTRAFFFEMSGVLKMMVLPGLGVVGPPPPTYPVEVNYGRMYQMVTMTSHYDTQLQVFNPDDAWKDRPKDLYYSLKYWLQYPDIAVHKDFGAGAGGDPLGATVHYQRHGQHEGRIWEGTANRSTSDFIYKPSFEMWKFKLADSYDKMALALEIVGGLAFLLRILAWRKAPLSPLMKVALIFALFTGVRVLAISYISVYMGFVDGRLLFSTFVVVLLMAPLVVADLFTILPTLRGRVVPAEIRV